MDAAALVAWIRDARARTFELLGDLSDRELRVAELDIVNPLDWESGHVGWFQEKFALRDVDQRPSLHPRADALWDSIAIEHHVRWKLDLPPRAELYGYLEGVRDAAAAAAARAKDEALYRHMLAVFHEDMHDEAFTYTRQTMAYPAPRLSVPIRRIEAVGSLPGDVEIGGGTFFVGARRGAAPHLWDADDSFVFDNEEWGRDVEVAPFRIARAPVTQAEYAAFADDGGDPPVYWRRGAGGWERRHFDRWVPLEPHQPVIHVSWNEAQAYCRWAGRRLPTEVEWEVAASAEPDAHGRIAPGKKRRYPWGDAEPTPAHVNMDAAAMGCADVAALAAGDSAFGCRQLLGNVWEWCEDTFGPYPDFEPGPYREYSQPLFGTTKVLRGGCWVTRARLIRNTWRNYYEPHRRDVWAGFRTCAR
jgi:EgtB-related family protein